MRVHKTEVILNARAPEWRPIRMEMAQYGGWDSVIEIECWDQDPKGKADYIGKCKTTLRELTFYKHNPIYALVNRKKKRRIGYYNSGLLCVPKLTTTRSHVF